MGEPADVIALRGAEMGETPEESRQKPIADYLAPGYSTTDVPDLGALAPVRSFQPLLRELLLGGPDDFWIRLHFMRELASDGETSWTQDSLAIKFAYIAEEPRRDIVRRLTRGGWISFADGKYSVTALGEAATTLTGLLGDLAHKAGDLGVVVHSLKLAKEIGVDGRQQLDHLRNKLARIGEEMQRAYDSKSEHAILGARAMLESSLPWVESARQVLEKYKLDTPEEHERVRHAHDLLSRLHHWASALQRALNDIGKRRIHLGGGGLTMRDITAFLAHADIATLNVLADGSIHFPIHQRFVIGDNMLSEGEYELCVREIPDDERRGWTDARHAENLVETEEKNGPIEDFVDDLRALIAVGEPIQANKFVARNSWATTAYRFTLLALAGGRMETTDAPEEAVGSGRALATLPVDIEFDHRKRDTLDGVYATEMTSGWVRPRAGKVAATEIVETQEPQETQE